MNKIRKILIMGLPGSGKTTLAKRIVSKLKAGWVNADKIRKKYNDWDFSPKGRLRQAERLNKISNKMLKSKKFVVVDFICPTEKSRKAFKSDLVIWMNTIKVSRYHNINKIFTKPKRFDFEITSKNSELWSYPIIDKIYGYTWNSQAPTTQMLGRFQPWHLGHRLLFENALLRRGQVNIQVKNVWKIGDNPLSFTQVKKRIIHDLKYFKKRLKITHMPNISEIIYGRKVGYKISKINLPMKIQKISGTKIRKLHKNKVKSILESHPELKI